jgi:hypothetical protein
MQNLKQSNSKLRYAYLLTLAGSAGESRLTTEFSKRKVVEYEVSHAGIDASRSEMSSLNEGRWL